MNKNKIFTYFLFSLFLCISASAQIKIKDTKVGFGWSNNSVNTVKFRKNALITYKKHQFIAYYNENSFLTLGKRKINAKNWETNTTNYKGNTKDAHNDISIAVDNDGYLHVSWDHHNTTLNYAKSITPLSLKLSDKMAMTGKEENRVTYPEFYNLPDGNLIFFYRSGVSGKGNMVINSYNSKSKKWTQIQHNLIDGEEARSAYWQACIDSKGTIHVSWVWRETWDVSTNHDLCYARSKDGGKTWEKSTGEKYQLPITALTAEYAWKIPQKSSLINQTAMTTDKNGNPFIVTYWSENKTPQYQIVYLKDGNWSKINTGFRKIPFNLGGGGTKRIPISRPEILINDKNETPLIYIIFRDEERGNKVSLAYNDLHNNKPWKIKDLTDFSIGQWEPNYDISLWKNKKRLDIFLQKVTQIDGEGIAKEPSSMVSVLQLKTLPK